MGRERQQQQSGGQVLQGQTAARIDVRGFMFLIQRADSRLDRASFLERREPTRGFSNGPDAAPAPTAQALGP
jgi:hypothetical protein